MNVKNVAFRVDSGSHIGIGHLMRCLTLAEGLFEIGIKISFITKNHIGHRSELIPSKFEVHLLEGGLKQPLLEAQKDSYDRWLGESWENDLNRVNSILETLTNIDLFIIDHYAIDSKYESQVNCKKLFVIDDLMNREHFCDYLLDQNLSADFNQYTKLIIKKNTSLLIGLDYALLRQEFKELRKKINPSSFERSVENVLIFFGGADLNGNTLKMIESLSCEVMKKFSFKIILHEKHSDYLKVKEIINSLDEAVLISQSSNMAADMSWSDLFVGASGSISWERACLGVASAVLSVADNQLLVCNSLVKKECIHYIGKDNEIDSNGWNIFFENIVNKTAYWSVLRKNSFLLVDGKGVERVVEKLKG